jgi:hypothetical protein
MRLSTSPKASVVNEAKRRQTTITALIRNALGFPPDDPLFVDVVLAQHAMQKLMMELHYLGCQTKWPQLIPRQHVAKYTKTSCNIFHDLTLRLSVVTTKLTQAQGRRIMNANFTIRMAMGCSILVAVCQSAALAGGKAGGGGSGGSSHVPNFNVVRSVNTVHAPVLIQKFQTLNTNGRHLNTSTLHVTPKVLHVTPTLPCNTRTSGTFTLTSA